MSLVWMSTRDLHALASARFSSPATRAREAAFFLSELCGKNRSQVTLKWQLNAVEISVKVFDQKLDGGPGMQDIDEALDVVGYVHGFRVLSKTQQGANLVFKVSATIARMDACFVRARRKPAAKSTLQAMLIGFVLYWIFMWWYHGRFCWCCELPDEEGDRDWELEDE